MDDLELKLGLTKAKCDQRRKLAAIRDGIEGAEVTLYPSGITGSEVWNKGTLLHATGELPGADDEALSLINLARKAEGEKPLANKDIYIHYMEAANGNFIPDRFMFLDASTLRNLAQRGEQGIAFMNSHRTGGLSTPSEQPYGRTFSGRYEELEHQGKIHKRALLGVYMLKGHYPNGTQMPSTDEFHKGIDGGTLKDVSIGLNGGLRICDVCARELGDKDCPHAPATKNGLTPEQMEAQTARGVTGGKASYTVVDGQPYEVSAVFKGAVPGAGFRKAMSLKAKAQTDQQFGQEVLSAYGSMMGPGDLKFFDKGKPKMKFSDVLRLMGMAQTAGIQLEDLEEGDLATLKSGTMVPARITQEQTLTSPEAEKLSADRLALEADRKALAFERFQLQADTYVNPLAAEGKVTGPDVDFLKLAFVQAAMDDKFSPVTLEVGGEKLSRVEVLKKANAGRVKNPLLNGQAITSKDDLPEGLSILPSQDAITSPDGEMSLERRRELLGYTDVGTSIASTLSK